jgi:signal transduction histidine kinase
LKRHHTASSIVASLFLLALIVLAPQVGISATLNQNNTASSRADQIVAFKTYQGALGPEQAPPLEGWSAKVPALELVTIDQADVQSGNQFLWGRMTFDRAQLGSGPLAIYTIGNRDQFKVFVNGQELFRNYVSPEDGIQSWYRPFLIVVPQNFLKNGTNEILFQNSGWRDLAVGRTAIGPQEVLVKEYDAQMLLRIDGPIMANAMMAILGACAFVLWAVRRTEKELLFLTLTSVFWLVRNYHFYTDKLPFAPDVFAAITHVSLYFAAAASASFGISYLKTPYHQKIILAMFGFGILVSVLHLILPLSPMVMMVATFIIALLTSVIGVIGSFRTRSFEYLMMSLVMSSIIVSSTHDFGRNEDLWDGAGFYFQPYVGFFFTAVFLVSFGRRAQRAFVALETTNEALEDRVMQVGNELAISEQERRTLEVNQAVADERVRLMREMHDGIGSNLLTALAIAEHQSQSETTIKTLRRALSDLKITVDSLEPIDGDIVVLIGNLRHRMARDLMDAGLTCVWEMKECRPIRWLDATSALHGVRIIQEAISNVIEHSGANEIRIGCYEDVRSGQDGVTIFVSDNGCGFDRTVETNGKGIANMKSRANAINAIFDLRSELKVGATITLWLPEIAQLPMQSSAT